MRSIILFNPLVLCPAGLEFSGLAMDEIAQTVVLQLISSNKEGMCPLCCQTSTRIQSRYTRTLADLPWANLMVYFKLKVRRFWCTNAACACRIFAERLPQVANYYARRTLRQSERVAQFGFEAGGVAGARLAQKAGIDVSADTILRTVARTPFVPIETETETEMPQLVGVDDFAFKKGHTYGSIIVDLTTHRVLDLLPDRKADSWAKWLQEHPGIAIITRDRAGAYAEGSRRGAPQAQQIADRFHLLVNLSEAVKQALDRNRAWLTAVVDKVTVAAGEIALPVVSSKKLALSDTSSAVEVAGLKLDTGSPPNHHCELTVTAHQKRQAEQSRARRQRRQDRYEQVLKLDQQGYTQLAIQRHLGLHRNTIKRYLQAGQFPELVPRVKRQTKLTDYEGYLRERWASGERKVKTLFEELQERGFEGCKTVVYDYVRTILEGWPSAQLRPRVVPLKVEPALSPRQGAWLLVAEPSTLSLEQQNRLLILLSRDEQLVKIYSLSQNFKTMLQEHRINEWGIWLSEAKESGVSEMQSFCSGLERDEQAVKAAIISELSNGQVEGQVNRLKMIKRQMFGRAGLALLKKRVIGMGAKG